MAERTRKLTHMQDFLLSAMTEAWEEGFTPREAHEIVGELVQEGRDPDWIPPERDIPAEWHCDYSASGLYAALLRLEKKGWVRREQTGAHRGEHRAQWRWFATEVGERALSAHIRRENEERKVACA